MTPGSWTIGRTRCLTIISMSLNVVQPSYRCFRDICSAAEFCDTKAKLCIPCKDFLKDCFTPSHKRNCTAFCIEQNNKAELGHNLSTSIWQDNIAVFMTLIVLVLLVIIVAIVLCWKPSLRERLEKWLISVRGHLLNFFQFNILNANEPVHNIQHRDYQNRQLGFHVLPPGPAETFQQESQSDISSDFYHIPKPVQEKGDN